MKTFGKILLYGLVYPALIVVMAFIVPFWITAPVIFCYFWHVVAKVADRAGYKDDGMSDRGRPGDMY